MKRNQSIEIEWTRKKIGIVAAKWNSFITDEMMESALHTLKTKGVKDENIYCYRCPGAFELPLASKWCLENLDLDGVVAIGAVIQGGTPHFDYVCDAVTRGLTDLNLSSGKPVSFGVLTTDTIEQAMERASTEKGNKGAEATLALCDMIQLKGAIGNVNQ